MSISGTLSGTRLELARNPALTPAAAARLAVDDDGDVRRALADNPSAPDVSVWAMLARTTAAAG